MDVSDGGEKEGGRALKTGRAARGEEEALKGPDEGRGPSGESMCISEWRRAWERRKRASHLSSIGRRRAQKGQP